MRSIKPGRGPSAGRAIGGVAAAIFGVFWIGFAGSIGAPPFFLLFGVIFIVAALGQALYGAYNATSDNRFSEWDITEPGEERDPLDQFVKRSGRDPRASDAYRRPTETRSSVRKIPGEFCPFCGEKVQQSYDFCPKCGKDI